MWVVKATVFKLVLRMQDVVFLLISTCIWSMMEFTSMMLNKEQRTSKYTAQMIDCGVPGKIQLLQIPETCEGASKEGEMATLRKTYVLSHRKLIEKRQAGCLQGGDEEFEYGEEAYSWNHLLREAEVVLLNAVNPCSKLRDVWNNYVRMILMFLSIQYAKIMVMYFAGVDKEWSI